MSGRAYYSRRQRGGRGEPLALEQAVRLFANVYAGLETEGYFQQAFGYYCIDGGTFGRVGRDPSAFFLRKLGKDGLWPLAERSQGYREDDLFDVAELLYDLVAKPLHGRYHAQGDCGWHYHAFDREAGRARYRDEVNQVLADYAAGYRLTREGEIVALPPPEPGAAPSDAITAGGDEPLRGGSASPSSRRGRAGDDCLDLLRDCVTFYVGAFRAIARQFSRCRH
jgi:hypothetical protein